MISLRFQWVGVMILAVLLPAVPVGLTARSLIRRSLDPLLVTEIEQGAEAGLQLVREELEEEKGRFTEAIQRGARLDTLDLAQLATNDPIRSATLSDWSQEADFVVREGDRAEIAVGPERIEIDGSEHLVAFVRAPGGEPVWLARALPHLLVEWATRLTETVQLLETLRQQRATVIRSLLASFLAVYAVIALAVLLIGLTLASRISRPMRLLQKGIDAVAAGDLDVRIPEGSRGEAARLLGNFNHMVGRLRSQREEQRRLERLEAWRQIARRLAHEIKNPLTPIQLAAQQIRDAYPGSEPEYRKLLDEGTEIIEEEVRSLRCLVSEFSRFARLPKPRMEWVELEALLREIVTLYGSDRVTSRITGPESGTRIWCDRDQIHRALLNLIDNALAAQNETGSKEPVEMAATFGRPGGMVRIDVVDRGPGVPVDQRRRIFEPDVSSKSEGMGLGLAIVETTIANHGGRIELSDSEGGGAIFTLLLPDRPQTTGEGEE